MEFPYKGLLLDGDGTLWDSDTPIHGAKELLNFAMRRNIELLLITNNAFANKRVYTHKVNRVRFGTEYGFPPEEMFNEQRVITPIDSISLFYNERLEETKNQNPRVYLIGGGPDLEFALKNSEFRLVDDKEIENYRTNLNSWFGDVINPRIASLGYNPEFFKKEFYRQIPLLVRKDYDINKLLVRMEREIGYNKTDEKYSELKSKIEGLVEFVRQNWIEYIFVSEPVPYKQKQAERVYDMIHTYSTDIVATNCDKADIRHDLDPAFEHLIHQHPVTGAFVGFLREGPRKDDVKVHYLGKSQGRLLKVAYEKMRLAAKNEVLMIGDKLDTDIQAANVFGFHSALVETGGHYLKDVIRLLEEAKADLHATSEQFIREPVERALLKVPMYIFPNLIHIIRGEFEKYSVSNIEEISGLISEIQELS